ncbi:thioredoxin family protein [Nocardioides koreensis]
MTAGAWVLIVAVVAAVGFGLYRASTDGRFRGTHRVAGAGSDREQPVSADEHAPTAAELPPSGAEHAPSDAELPRSVVELPPSVVELPPSVVELVETTGLEIDLGERATLLQFSSAFCAPCRATRRTLTEVAAAVPGVVHVEVDAEHHLEAVRALNVLRTPTTLVLDARGAEIARASGAPRKEQVLSALEAAVG